MTELVSIIVATYNRPDALDAVLRSLSRQSDQTFEVLVADDGSKPDTAAVIAGWKGRFACRLVHVWHPDQGFRLAEIRNRAIVAAAGEYCVFLDGDCLARPNLIAAHRELAERGWFVTGNRILVSRRLSQRILSEHLAAERWSNSEWIAQRLRGGINRLGALFQLPLGPLRRMHAQTWRGARACNLGIWRSDLVAVNGFDSSFSGWGREDSDLFVRLMRAGTRRKDGRMATGVLHLWHAEANRSHLPDNDRRLSDVIGGDRILALRGLSAIRDDYSLPTGAS
jgi:glycosyltransferase involved in cell wall biosynthesis